ncbi:hypothetical protein DID88_001056 [Monilinia fructigena]|uniref:Uncharacterized protein n=1 Tax=Monilinia fructigena TaxID=38457 RepID=A0A395IZ07_9HELO|nr:hypothetical protein DID88_001056 [Monilinia fructigena]
MDSRRLNTFNPTADEFTPSSSYFNRSISNCPTENANTAGSFPNNRAVVRFQAPYGPFSQSTIQQQGNTYRQSNTYHQENPYQQYTPNVQANSERAQHGFHPYPRQVVPMAPAFHRPVEQYASYQQSIRSVPENHRFLEYENSQCQGAPMSLPLYGPAQQSNYQQFSPAVEANRRMAQYSSHPSQDIPMGLSFYSPAQHRMPVHSATPAIPAANPFFQIPYPLFRNFIPNSKKMAPRNNPTPHRRAPATTPQMTSVSAGRTPPTPESTSDSACSVIPEVTGSSDSAAKEITRKKPEKDELFPEDLVPGCIVWLADYEDGHEAISCVKNHQCNDPEKEKGGRNHPVAVLQIHQRHGSSVIGDLVCDVAIMTTLKCLSLEPYIERLRNIGPNESSEWFLKRTMPLSWQPQKKREFSSAQLEQSKKVERRLEIEHGPELLRRGNELLFLSKGTMQKRTYVRVHHIYAVPLKQLQTCSIFARKAWMVRLDESSYGTVMERLGLNPGPWEENVQKSVEAAPERLLRLRDEEIARAYAHLHNATGSSPSTLVNRNVAALGASSDRY